MQFRTTGSTRLAASVAAVMALTIGSGALGSPGAAAATADASVLPSLIPGTKLLSAGAQGYVLYVPTGHQDYTTYRWVPYAGGPSRDFTPAYYEGLSEVSGELLAGADDGYNGTGVDLATGESFRTEQLPGVLDALYEGVAGSAIALRPDNALGEKNPVWLDTKDAAPREVRGLPEGTVYLKVRPATAAVGLLDHRTAGGEQRVGLIDLATATVSETYAKVEAVSATRVAWTEPATAADPRRVVVRDRATGKDTVVPAEGTGALGVGLLGDWLLFGGQARHLVTGETVTLFDRADALVTATDGTAAVVQGVRGRNTGIHRVTLGTDGKPVVSFVARSTTPGGLVHDIDADGYPDLLGRDSAGTLWRDSAADGRPWASAGTGWQGYDKVEVVGDAVVAGVGDNYAADVVARDADGVLWLHQGDGRGGFAPRTRIGGGWQVYDKIAGGSDLTGDGRADLVAIDTTGGLYLYEGTGDVGFPYDIRKKIGTGWGIYNQLTAVGDIGGATGGDLVARDADGVLWIYLGKGDGTYTARTAIGGGWQVYGQLTGAGDVDHDGRNDLLAHEPSTGRVYLYSGTGDWRKPFLPKALTDIQAGSAYNHIA
ncbi:MULTISPECIES: FG-GAP repeat domain-containing protein [unclassified Streptomyces]|uniref:FG-GAP repeat domain-containing protein n=1 Tax=unclassified Streptomyces TaxID=2593676 RepID=UPI0036F60FD6